MTDLSLHRQHLRSPSGHATSEPAEKPYALSIDNLVLTRMLVFAPHPDDESLGVGALLSCAAAHGASIRVVFLTDGDNNPWPQRVARRQWKISAQQHVSWGRLRRHEARRALATLGVDPAAAAFFGLPDDRLATLERRHLVALIQDTIAEFDPTLLVIPSIDDFHPDHRTAHRAIMSAVSMTRRPMILSYIVHGRATDAYRAFAAGPESIARKHAAIGCHSSQLLLSRGRFMRYAARAERYAVIESLIVPDETRRTKWLAKLRHVISVIPGVRRR